MKYTQINTRILDEANYYIKNKSTIRKTAEHFNLSKTTIHNDLSKKLKHINSKLYDTYLLYATINQLEAHTRGGYKTKLKYLKQHKI